MQLPSARQAPSRSNEFQTYKLLEKETGSFAAQFRAFTRGGAADAEIEKQVFARTGKFLANGTGADRLDAFGDQTVFENAVDSTRRDT